MPIWHALAARYLRQRRGHEGKLEEDGDDTPHEITLRSLTTGGRALGPELPIRH